MAIGYQTTQSGIDSTAGQLAVAWKQIAYEILQFTAPVLALAHADLVALGFTDADATAISAAVTNMSVIAGLYYGTTAALALNYSTAFAPLRGAAG